MTTRTVHAGLLYYCLPLSINFFLVSRVSLYYTYSTMSLQINGRPQKLDGPISVRLARDNQEMLRRALGDHPILSRIINECVRRQLTKAGYARKRDTK